MKVYTKSGDKGTTSLIGGERVSKADLRVEAYGTVDELSAHLALWADSMNATTAHQMFAPAGHVKMSAARRLAAIAAQIDQIQIDLMTVEAMLATGAGGEGKVAPLPPAAIERLEAQIDAMSEGLPPLKGFTVPGGHPIVSQSHLCRTVCRRAERAAVRAAAEFPATELPAATPAAAEFSAPGHAAGAASAPADTLAAAYLNRLSDWLYTAGRRAIEILSIKEQYWTPEKF
jgi:cob(I)alamin adenosyltransferase